MVRNFVLHCDVSGTLILQENTICNRKTDYFHPRPKNLVFHPKMTIFMTVIPILMHSFIFFFKISLFWQQRNPKRPANEKRCYIMTYSLHLLSQICDVIQSDIALYSQVHLRCRIIGFKIKTHRLRLDLYILQKP